MRLCAHVPLACACHAAHLTGVEGGGHSGRGGHHPYLDFLPCYWVRRCDFAATRWLHCCSCTPVCAACTTWMRTTLQSQQQLCPCHSRDTEYAWSRSAGGESEIVGRPAGSAPAVDFACSDVPMTRPSYIALANLNIKASRAVQHRRKCAAPKAFVHAWRLQAVPAP